MRRIPDWIAGVLVALFVIGMPGLIFAYQNRQTAGLITIDAHQWSYSPNQITVKAGEPIHLRLESRDASHGFTIPDLGIEVPELYPGHPVTVDIAPPPPGKYLFYCTRVCGLGHAKMSGYLVVTAP